MRSRRPRAAYADLYSHAGNQTHGDKAKGRDTMDFGLDGWQKIASQIALILALAYVIVLWVGAFIWTYRDISARTRDTFSQVVSLMLIVFFLPGLIVYLLLRPAQTIADSYDRQLEAEALLHEIQEQATCPSCRRRIDDDFIVCPFCRTSLRTPCENCSRAMSTTWVLCPYCGASQTVVAATTARRAATSSAPESETVVSRRPRRPASTAKYTPPAVAPAPTAAQPAESSADVSASPSG